MAKFLQDTIEEMAVTAKKKKTQEVVSEFANFFEKVSATLHVEVASLFEKINGQLLYLSNCSL